MKKVNVTSDANKKRLIIHNVTGKRCHTITGEEKVLFAKTFWQENFTQVTGQDIILAMQEETPYSEAEEYYLLASDAEEYRVPTAAEREAMPIEKIRDTVGRLGEESLPLLRQKWPIFSFELDPYHWGKDGVLVTNDQESVRAETVINTSSGLLTISLL